MKPKHRPKPGQRTRCAAIVLAVCLALSLTAAGCDCAPQTPKLPAAPVQIADFALYAASEPTLPYRDPALQTPFEPALLPFYYQRLTTDAQRDFYRAILGALIDCATNTPVYAVSPDEGKQTAAAVAADYPQFYELAGDFGVRTEGESGCYCVIYYATADRETEISRRARLYEAANTLLAALPADTTPPERCALLYEAVTAATGYDFAEGSGDGSNRLAHTAYGALVEGKAVCDGYARAFALLAQYAGIPAATVNGVFGSVAHSWNLVRLDGQDYFADPTADDSSDRYAQNGGIYTGPAPDEDAVLLDGGATHRYYLLTYSDMAADHDFELTDFASAQTLDAAARPLLTESEALSRLQELLTQNPDPDRPLRIEFGISGGIRFPDRLVEQALFASGSPLRYALAASGSQTAFFTVWFFKAGA